MSCQFDKRIKPREEEHKNRNIMSGKLLVDELEANADALESQRVSFS